MNCLKSIPFAALAAAAVAQIPDSFQPAAPTLSPTAAMALPCVPVHTHAPQPGDAPYGIWAAGRDWKASFHDGMTFVPRLGRAYPHNQPWSWRTLSVRVGASELLDGRAPSLTHTDLRVEYAHGVVTEAYDVQQHGLEQTFTLGRRPAAEGDLVIRGAIASALWSQPVAEQHGALVFRDHAGLAIVGYGAATAIDVDGDRFAMTTGFADGCVTLRLAAADLARADFPLVVDPLLTSVLATGVGTSIEAGEVDVATERTNVSVNSVYSFVRHYSAVDSDVTTLLGASTLTSATSLFSDLSTAASADHPRAAFVPATGKWVIAYQNLITATQVMQIRVGLCPGGQGAPPVSTSLPHLLAAGTHEWRPVVGGIDDGGTGTQALIVYQQETGTTAFANTATSKVMGVLFNTTTTLGSWGTPFLVHGGASEDAERPSVNRTAEAAPQFSWFVVCQGYDNTVAGGDDWDLFGRLVTNAGVVSAPNWISSLGTTHKLGPVVDGYAGRYCVAFSTATTALGKTLDVVGTTLYCERVDWAHGAANPSAAGNYPAEVMASNSLRILETNAIAHHLGSRSHWAITWRSSSTAPAIYAVRVGYRGKAVQTPDVVATTTAQTPGAVGVLYTDDGRVTLAWEQFSGSTSDVWVRHFNLAAPALTGLAGSGCGAGTLDWQGPAVAVAENQRIGCELAGPRVQGAGANDIHVLLVATASANVPLVDPLIGANCVLLVPFTGPDYLGMMPLAVGANVTWTLPLPESLPPMTLTFQDWVLQAANNQLWGTRRLEVPLVK